MALQPVAVGINGEIGYIAVPQPTPDTGAMVAPEMELATMDMDHTNFIQHMYTSSIHNPSNINSPQVSGLTITPADGAGGGAGGRAFIQNSGDQATTQHSQESLRLESERMKHELHVLQQKISSLNTARMNTTTSQIIPNSDESGSTDRGSVRMVAPLGTAPEGGTGHSMIAQNETAQLTTELQLIENTIKDREREMSITRSNGMVTTRTRITDGQDNIDYGSYVRQGT